MKPGSRANVASSFTVKYGALLDETYAVFAAWDFERSKRENLDRLRQENFIGASSATWLRDVAKVLNRRFDPAGRDRPLVMLAKHGLPVEEWKPLRSLTEPLQVAKDNGAKRALIPIENKRNFLDVSADIMEHVDPIFFGDPKTAAMKVLGG